MTGPEPRRGRLYHQALQYPRAAGPDQGRARRSGGAAAGHAGVGRPAPQSDEGRRVRRARTAELTRNELKILAYLMGRPGEIVSREDLIDALWDSQFASTTTPSAST